MANTTNFGWETPDDTDLVKDGALAMRTLGSAIDTSLVDLKGGTTGQNLRKNSNTDMDFTWAGDATNTVIDAEGDLLVGDSADTLQRLAIGTTGQVLTVDTAVDGKIKWAAAASGSTFAGAFVFRSTAQSINNATLTDITFDSESFDTDAFHSTTTNTDRLTVPAGKGGYYLVVAKPSFAGGTTGIRQVYIYKNTTIYAELSWVNVSNNNADECLSTIVNLSVGDYVKMAVWHNNGGALNINGTSTATTLTMTYLGA